MTETTSSLFTVERDGPVVIWRYKNLPKNLWTVEAIAEYQSLLTALDEDDSLRAGIFTSGLPDVFIQHFDVSLLVAFSEARRRGETRPPASRPAYRPGSKVTIAAINASLAGGGLELAQSCDFRFMARGALAAQPEVAVGILAGGGGTQRMPRLIGLDKALDLQLTARRISADEAERLGLVTRACNPEELMPKAIAFAKSIAVHPPKAVAAIRKAIYEGTSMPLEEGLALESELFAQLLESDEALELMQNYVKGGQDPGQILT